MDYTKMVSYGQPEALAKLKEALKENKWGVLSDIDVKGVLKEKIGVEMESYDILDVCNPRLADRALKLNKKVGLVLPCKMAVYADEGKTNIGLYLPTRMLPAEIGGRQELMKLAEEAEAALKKIMDGLPG